MVSATAVEAEFPVHWDSGSGYRWLRVAFELVFLCKQAFRHKSHRVCCILSLLLKQTIVLVFAKLAYESNNDN